MRFSFQSSSRGTKGFCKQLKMSGNAKSFFFYIPRLKSRRVFGISTVQRMKKKFVDVA